MDRSVAIATRYGLEHPGFQPCCGTRFPVPTTSHSNLLQNGCWLSLSAKKRPGHGVDHRVPSSANVENGQNYKIYLEPLERDFLFFQFNIGELQKIFWTVPTIGDINHKPKSILRSYIKFYPHLINNFAHFVALQYKRLPSTLSGHFRLSGMLNYNQANFTDTCSCTYMINRSGYFIENRNRIFTSTILQQFLYTQ